MDNSKISFSGSEVSVAGRSWRVRYRITQAELVGDRVLVLYDYMTGARDRLFQNLEAFTLDGVHLWTAEHPSTDATGSYVALTSLSPLRAGSFDCFDCTLDPSTGKLLKSHFTK